MSVSSHTRVTSRKSGKPSWEVDRLVRYGSDFRVLRDLGPMNNKQTNKEQFRKEKAHAGNHGQLQNKTNKQTS